jgi:outer membrane lipoprotein LolB
MGVFKTLLRLLLPALLASQTACTNIRANQTTLPNKQLEVRAHLTQIASIRDFKIEGRLGVQSDKQGISGTVHWHHLKVSDEMNLYSPLGGKIAEILNDNNGVTLTTSNNQVFKAQDPEALTESTLGWRLPITKLSDWIVGRPANGAISNVKWDDDGKLKKFNQEGWEISYLEYKESNQVVLPSKMNIRNSKLNLRLIIDRWELPRTQETSSLNVN